MAERNQAAVGSGMARRKWTLVIAGTAVVLLIAGVAIQVARPTSAYPEDGASAGKAASAGRATTAAPPQSERKMAKVGTQFITYEELAAECVQRHGKEILENLISRRIIQQACDAQGIEVSEAEVEAEIGTIAQKFHMDRQEYLKLIQAERNVTPSQYRRDIIWPMLAMKKLAGEVVEISDKDLQAAFVRNYGPRVKARAIVLDNQRRAAEVWKLANDKPEDFERLARQHSVDASSRHLDGMIPPIPRYAGSEALEDAAFKLKDGEISAVIQVGLNQFIILKCEGRTEPAVTKMDEQIEQLLREQLHEEKTQVAVGKVFEKIKEETRVDNYLTGVSSGGERKGSAGKAGAAQNGVRPAGAAGAARKTAKPISDADADVDTPAETTPARPAVPKKAAKSAKSR